MLNLSAHEFFILGFPGLTLPKNARTLIKNNPLGGVILFKHNIESLEQVVALNGSIINENITQAPLISVDQEGGRVARLRGICTDIPPLFTLISAFRNDEHLAYRLGALQARELVSLGFTLNFAPVCDVFCHKDNEVIGDRSFSENPMEAARFASLYIQGLQGAGVAACAKHFPGHGRTSVDSHLALPVINTSLRELESCELVPFRAAIEANVATIMTAHIVTQCLDEKPATLSEKTLEQLLRKSLGFHNVVISDDLDMKAVADHYSLEEILQEGILAGVDMFIIGNNFEKGLEAIQIVEQLITKYEAVRTKLAASKARIDALRSRYVGKPLAPDLNLAKKIVRCAPHLELVKAYG